MGDLECDLCLLRSLSVGRIAPVILNLRTVSMLWGLASHSPSDLPGFKRLEKKSRTTAHWMKY